MLRISLILTTFLFVFTSGHISGDAPSIQCKGEVKLGKLEISEKSEGRSSAKIPESCTSLEIRAENGTDVNWEKIEAIPLPKLKIFKLYLTKNNFGDEFDWKKISLFGYSPKEISGLGIDLFVFYNELNVLNFDAPFKYLSIRMIDPNPVLNAFVGQDVQLKTVFIVDSEVNDLDFTAPEGVTTLILEKVQIKNLPAFIQKFGGSLEDLTIQNIRDMIDISDFIPNLKYLKGLTLEHCGLTLKDGESAPSLKMLTLTACVEDKSFKDNVGKIVPNLTTLKYSNIAEKFDLADLLVYKQLRQISINSASLTFTKPIDQYKSLGTLELANVEFDLANFVEVASKTFPNLTYLSVDANAGGTRPTQEFMNEILANIPDIQRVSLDPFPLDSHDRKGTFELIYRYNPQSEE